MKLKKVALFLISVQIVKAATLCQTPNYQNGDCVPINECPALFKLLEHRPVTRSNAQFLCSSQCGFVGAYPKVCCPIGAAILPTNRPPTVAKPITSSLLPKTDKCGSSTDDRLYRGNRTELDKYPWLALLEYEQPGGGRGFHCGGALISKRYVLTAAHCVEKKKKIVSVRLGEHNTKTDPDCVTYIHLTDCAPPTMDVPVEEIVPHKNYNPHDKSYRHDIALLRLQRDVNFTYFINPICLPTEEVTSYVGERLYVGGWGRRNTESDVKLQDEVTIKQPSACSTGTDANLGEDQLCAGGKNGGHSCIVDSGGPLTGVNLVQDNLVWQAVGVASIGPSTCGMENRPGVYTRVSKYIEWIVENMKS